MHRCSEILFFGQGVGIGNCVDFLSGGLIDQLSLISDRIATIVSFQEFPSFHDTYYISASVGLGY